MTERQRAYLKALRTVRDLTQQLSEAHRVADDARGALTSEEVTDLLEAVSLIEKAQGGKADVLKPPRKPPESKPERTCPECHGSGDTPQHNFCSRCTGNGTIPW